MLISFANIGCQDEICYSCDPLIDSWAKDNIESLEKMNRKELVKLNPSKQKAAFRTFTPKKRKQLWNDKFKQIKSLKFSKEELKHLKIFEKFLTKYNFSKEISLEQETFLISWFEEGKLNYNWSPYFLISGFGLLNDDAVLNKVEFEKKFPDKADSISTYAIDEDTDVDDLELGIGGGGGGNCDCRWDITCQLSSLGDCSDTDCKEVRFGCGWLAAQTCIGDCSG